MYINVIFETNSSDYKKKKYRFYSLLNGINGGKANINVSYHYDSIQTHQKKSGTHSSVVLHGDKFLIKIFSCNHH